MSVFDHNGSTGPLVPARRRELIATRLRSESSVSVGELEAEFGISAMTALEREGRARRTHGGARIAVAMLDGSKFERAGLSAITEIRHIEKVLVADATPAQIELLTAAGVDMEELR